MAISNSLSRFAAYFTRHGFVATIRRAGLAAKRAIFSNRMVVFYCDLGSPTAVSGKISGSLRVERLRNYAELDPKDLGEIASFWNPKLANRNIKERFDQGASIWLIKSGDTLAGYGWTLQGRTIEPYYFPLAQDDIHFFDFHVFPAFRGRGMNPYLVNQMLDQLATDRRGRAFIEAAEWNKAQLSSLGKTRFRYFGRVKSSKIFGHNLVSWTDNKAVAQIGKVTEPSEDVLTGARSNEP